MPPTAMQPAPTAQAAALKPADPRVTRAFQAMARQVTAVTDIPGSFADGPPHTNYELAARPSYGSVCEQDTLVLSGRFGEPLSAVVEQPSSVGFVRRFRPAYDFVGEHGPGPTPPVDCGHPLAGTRWVIAPSAYAFDQAYRTLRGLQIAQASGVKTFTLECISNGADVPCDAAPFTSLAASMDNADVKSDGPASLVEESGGAFNGRRWTLSIVVKDNAPRSVVLRREPPPLY